MGDRRIRFVPENVFLRYLEGFNDNCVLVHGNFCLRSMLKDARSDQFTGYRPWALMPR